MGGGITFQGNNILNVNAALFTNNGYIEIGENVSFNRNCTVVAREKISIGEGTRIGPNVCIYDHNHKFDFENGIYPDRFSTAGIIIGKSCWIGANVTILKGTHIGDGSIIGAGVVVKGKIPDHTIMKNDGTMEQVLHS